MSKFPTINFPNNFPAPPPEYAVCPPPPANLRSEVMLVKDRAEAGIPEPSIAFARMLFKGIWDCEQMMMDSLSGRLQPAPADSRLDPYLVLPRDPVRAVQLLKRVAETAQPDQTFFKNQARDLLVFCQVNGLAGLPTGVVTYANAQSLSPEDGEALFVNGKSAGGPGSSSYGFTPLPDVRPCVDDPIGDIFMNAAISSRDRSFWLGIVLTAAGIVLSAIHVGAIVPGIISTVILITLPFVIFYYLEDKYGVKQKLPICDCQRIRLARELTFEEYPPSFSQNAIDPFLNSSVKNLLRIKQFFFWSYLFAPIIVFGTFVLNTDLKFYDRTLAILVIELFLMIGSIKMFFVGAITLAFEKKAPKFCHNNDGTECSFVGTIVLGFFFFFLHDNCCHDQAYAIIDRWHRRGAPKYAQIATINKIID